MFIWGHRGCRGIEGLDENTLPACQWAVEHGVQGLEFDVQVSNDGVPFVFHDLTAWRVGARKDDRTVESLDWATIEQIPLRQGGRIPRLEEMVQFAPAVRMNLEIKTLGAVTSVLNFLEHVNLTNWIVSSFEYQALVAMRAGFPNLELGYLLERQFGEAMEDCEERALAQIAELRPQRIHLGDTLCDTAMFQTLGSFNVPIHVWTVNDVERASVLREKGVSGIFTDDARLFQS